MNNRARTITDDFFATMADILNPNSRFSISGNYRDTPPETITDTYVDIVELTEWISYQKVKPQTLRVTWEKNYFEYEDADDVDPQVVKVEWLANKYTTDEDPIPHWINVTDLLKTQMDVNDLLK